MARELSFDAGLQRRNPSSDPSNSGTQATRSCGDRGTTSSDHPPAVERRQGRSGDPLIALGRLLDAARKLGGGQVLAVADESGLLVAGSGHFDACEELAAQAAAQRPASDSAGVRAVELKGARVLLCASGGDLDLSLSHAERGARRILAPGSSAHI